jgi:glycosyltransferase involved in cell wall biosynthesis
MPMYNERASVEQMVGRALEVLPTLTDDYEVLIVDDCSSDGSEEIAQRLASQHEAVRVIRHPVNRGYGAALRTGFFGAAKQLVFYTDCDEPVDLRELSRALPLATDYDAVVGYRLDRHDTPRRWLYSKTYNFLIRLLFGVPVRDVNFSFKLVHRHALEKVSLSARSVFIDGELLAEMVHYRLKIAEIPIEYHPRQTGSSNFDSFSAAWNTLWEIASYYWQRRRTSADHIGRWESRDA